MSSRERKVAAVKFISFSKEEIKAASDRYNAELVGRSDMHAIFNAGILSILEGSVKRRDAELTAQKLINMSLDNPQSIVACKNEIPGIIYPIRWYNRRTERMVGFSEWWLAAGNPPGIIKEIIQNTTNCGTRGFGLREALAKEASGMERKTASVFMMRLGYENLVPVDTHECNLLNIMGFDVEVPDHKTQSLPLGRKYLECENRIIRLARKVGVTPAVFHHAVLRGGREVSMFAMA